MTFLWLKILSKFIDMYRVDTVLPLILFVSEMLKIPRAKVKAYFLKKHAFVTNKCLAQHVFGKCSRATKISFKIHGTTQIVISTNFLFSRAFCKAILVSELYRLSRCIAPYK